ncbi:MAG: ABC transporter [Acidimicrobiia bacterium]|nr:ABC transporter [Acidimicrobiia bacterium]
MIAATAARVVERQVLAYRRIWYVFAAGFAEPVLYLLGIGVGVGELVGPIPGPGGAPVAYDAFVAPGLMATAAMNGAVLDTTIDFFVKYKYLGTYKAMLATPLTPVDVVRGTIGWSMLRTLCYSGAFLLAMVALGLVASPWGLLAVPVALLLAFSFGAAGVLATTWMRSFIDFDYVQLATVPMFLFSGVFFPLSRYPGWLATAIEVTPLYQGVEVMRRLVLGELAWSMLARCAYLLVLGLVCLRLAGQRVSALLQP